MTRFALIYHLSKTSMLKRQETVAGGLKGLGLKAVPLAEAAQWPGCGHALHLPCLDRLLRGHGGAEPRCPHCRAGYRGQGPMAPWLSQQPVTNTSHQ